MLIRNATSFQDLQNKKKLQAELLQMQIDNEALLEERVANFQNPNKPPPIPPQYKTTSELQQDSLYQQRLAIDNLKSIGADNVVAAQVSQNLLQSEDGIGALVKLNSNFPAIKESATKKITPQAINSVDGLMKVIDESFADIDNSLGFLSGTNSTNQFDFEPKAVPRLIPTVENLDLLNSTIIGIQTLVTNISSAQLNSIEQKLNQLMAVSPTDSQVDLIDKITSRIKRREIISKAKKLSEKSLSVNLLISILDTLGYLTNVIQDVTQSPNPRKLTQVETQQVLTDLTTEVGKNITQDLITQTVKLLSDGLRNVDANLLQKIEGLTNLIAEEEDRINQTLAQVMGVQLNAQQQNLQFNQLRVIQNQKVLNQKANQLGEKQLIARIQRGNPDTQQATFQNNAGNQQTIPVYEDRYIDQVPTTNGQPPNNRSTNVIFETAIDSFGNIANGLFIKAQDGSPTDLPQGPIAHPIDSYLYRAVIKENQNGVWRAFTAKNNPRYTKNELVDIVDHIEGDYIAQRVPDDDTYNLKDNPASALFPTQGFGIKKGFMARKIKVGKGIEIKEEIPRYKTFGKYIIHYPHLIEESVFNLKFPSTGSIPSIKPVKIDDNYKQFIIDILDTNKVNKRHYESLTPEEKNHFSRVMRGAKLENLLTFKTDEDEDKDYKRLELCLGEINAGNDNQKIKDEIKQLLKKFVGNGRVSKLKASDILLQL
jgi:hypothetical protein